ncbi:DeoR family transcriptional regulator [Aquibacillus halophilus]|uniref:DeoR family transcriptional regulator n=1 Tax=Aquibacillus halophilus TaxID=930132 RepID=A0A6A8DGN3_9BACI|nr:DeoR/GlpR family DNA-binding transcription regulator [Aquibacillus halophilus]MRH42047.1 DeoR family transcriptional regulator [Aquibacillus halophilus]
MLTTERYQIILQQLDRNNTLKIQELVDLTASSESTIRRDLSELEIQGKLIRIHGGATKKQPISQELSYPEKTNQNIVEKKAVASYAASLVNNGDCIYLDAGTSTFEMIPFLAEKQVTVVTNGLTHLDALCDYKISTYLLGGFVKHTTRALVGYGAQTSLNNYRFDKCFLGVNGIHPVYGFTTPDPEEVMIKKAALLLSQQAFVLADSSKLNQVSFAKIAELDDATIIINKIDQAFLNLIENKTSIKVVSS